MLYRRSLGSAGVALVALTGCGAGDGHAPPLDARATIDAEPQPGPWLRRWGSEADTGGFNPAGFGGTEVFRAVDVTSDGRVWVVGTHLGQASGLTDPPQPGSDDVSSLAALLGPDGSVLGHLHLAGSGAVYLYDVAATDEGAVICGGFEDRLVLGSTELVAPGDRMQPFVAGVDEDGAVQWAHAVTAGGFAVAGECIAHGGTIWATGSFGGTASFGDTALQAPAGELAAFVAAVDPADGTTAAWAVATPDGTVLGRGIAAIDDGSLDIVVAGSFSGTLPTSTGPVVAPSDDAWIARFGSDGTHRWTHALSTPGAAVARGVVHDAASDTIGAAGTFEGELVLAELAASTTGGRDLFLATFAGDGTPRSLDAYGSTEDEEGAELARLPDGWLFCGSTRGVVQTPAGATALAGDWDWLAVVVQDDGSWSASTGGGAGEDRAYACEHAGGRTAVVGWFSETAFFTAGSVTSAGFDDAVVSQSPEARL